MTSFGSDDTMATVWCGAATSEDLGIVLGKTRKTFLFSSLHDKRSCLSGLAHFYKTSVKSCFSKLIIYKQLLIGSSPLWK